nr:hypothetical protein [uncultured bacterium]
MSRLTNLAVLMLLAGCSGTLGEIDAGHDDGLAPGTGHGQHDAGVAEPRPDGSRPGTSDGGGQQSDGSVPGPESDAGPPVDACPVGPNGTLDVVSVAVTGPEGAAPSKGDELTVHVTLRNEGKDGIAADLTVLLDSFRFDDFRSIPLASTQLTACPGESTVSLRGGPFLSDPITNRQFALGSGDYAISGVVLNRAGALVTDSEFSGAAFNLATNNVLLVPVLYNQGYFDQLEGDFASPEAYLAQAFTRRNEVFTPDNPADPDGNGQFELYEGGFDQMMGVRHVFKAFIGFEGTFDSGEDWCYGAMDYASQVLGLKARWGGGGTRNDQHGFDYVIALSSNKSGGVAWSPFDVQVSGFIDRDVDRQQIIAVHESGHVFGSPHCDELGNGEGSNLQGYVMCAGEKHGRYPESFVWHTESRKTMSSRWN